MPLYQYVKAPVKTSPLPRSGRSIPLWRRLLPLSMFGAGLGVISYVAWPILSYLIITVPSYQPNQTANPVPDALIVSPLQHPSKEFNPVAPKESPLQPAVALASEPLVLDNPFDLTNPANWFPGAPTYDQDLTTRPTGSVKSYSLSIPKVGIEDATVVVGGNNLSKHMIQYGGTAIPGEFGNAVVFCHSTLPQFFDPNNYKTICSTLPDRVEKGDEIFVDIDGIQYRFVVNMISVVDPDNFSVLEQQYNHRSLSIITCVPPGTKWKRLVVRAELASE